MQEGEDPNDNPWLELTTTRALRLYWLPEASSPPPASTHEPEPRRLTDFPELRGREMELEPAEGTLFVVDSSDDNLLWQPGSIRSAYSSLAETVSALQPHLASTTVECLVFIPGSSWSIQDLVLLCTTAVAAHPAQELDCMLQPALPLPEITDALESGPLGAPQ